MLNTDHFVQKITFEYCVSRSSSEVSWDEGDKETEILFSVSVVTEGAEEDFSGVLINSTGEYNL